MTAYKLRMKKLGGYFFALFLLLQSFSAFAQPDASGGLADNIFKEEEAKFLVQLKNISYDSVIVDPLTRYAELEIESIYTLLTADTALSAGEKEKAIRSLAYFMNGLSRNLQQRKTDMYEIRTAFESYRHLLLALLYNKPFNELLVSLEPRISQLLATTFSQFKEDSLLDDIAVYKRVAATPGFVFQFLENKNNFPFTDSLLLEAAATDPMKFVFYLNQNKTGIQNKIRSTKNIYLQQIISLSGNKNISELLPFITQIAEQKITPEEILEKRTEAGKYFQLLTNTLQASVSKNSSSIFLEPLRAGIKQKALLFYVNPINELHNAADAVRFAPADGLRPEDIYYIITSCGDELYTSSYLGLYKRLMEHFKDQSADSLFTLMQYDNFSSFIRLAANYNVLADFLHNMLPQRRKELLKRFIAGIENNTNKGLEQAMDIADSFTGLRTFPDINELIQAELQFNLERCMSDQQYLGIRLYNILLQLFELVKQEKDLHKLWATLGNYEVLKREALLNKDGEIIQLVLFYGDEDGVASFSNFLKLYTDTSKWKIAKNKNWISIRSVSDQPLTIYANRPLDGKLELDLKAQDSLVAFLQQQSLQPTVLVHRGHSYHLDKTLKRLTPYVKLAILGSCGSYNKAISIAGINPDVQVIGSKKAGSKSVNDPVIDVINETLAGKNDLVWTEIGKKLAGRFSKDEATLNVFNEYFFPADNVSLFVLKLFNYYNRFV